MHVSEDIVVNVAEEMNLGLDSPVVPCVLERRVLIEEATVPSTHLVVGDHLGVLHTLLLQELGRFIVVLSIDPGGGVPMFVRDKFCWTLISYSRIDILSRVSIP